MFQPKENIFIHAHILNAHTKNKRRFSEPHLVRNDIFLTNKKNHIETKCGPFERRRFKMLEETLDQTIGCGRKQYLQSCGTFEGILSNFDAICSNWETGLRSLALLLDD